MDLLNLLIHNIENEELKEELKSIHPRQLVLSEDIAFEIYKINYEYDTIRGNHRDNATKIIIKQKPQNKNNKQISSDTMSLFMENLVKEGFIHKIKKFNEQNPKRALLNVKILGLSLLGGTQII